MAEWSHNHQVPAQCCVRSMGPFHSPLPYDLKTVILHKLSVAQGKRREESYLFEEGSSGYPVVGNDDEDREEAAWDQFCDTYGLGGLNPSEEGAILAGKAVGGSGSSS